MKTSTHDRGNGGFTLIEILLAVGITAVVMMTVGTAFVGILKAREEVRVLSESTSAGPRILTLIERDLRGLWHHNIKDNRIFIGTDRDYAGFPADRMDFVTTTDAVGAVVDTSGQPQRPTLCEVGYWLKESEQYPNEFRELWRREDPMVDDDLKTGGSFHLVYDRIKTFEITYFKSLGAKAEPLHEWDSSKDSELPRRIKIEFEIERKVPNRNRVSGAEVADFEETVKKYTRHIVFDRRYPEILKAGVAMVPLLPPRPVTEQTGPGGPAGPGGPGPGASSSKAVGEGATRVTQSGNESRVNQGNRPVMTQPGQNVSRGQFTTQSLGTGSPGVNLGELLGSGTRGSGGLSGLSGLFGGGK